MTVVSTFTPDPEIVLEIVEPLPVELTVSERGAKGDQGPQGEEGPRGPTGPQYQGFTFYQTAPLAVWTIPHNLGHTVDVAVYDSTGQRVEVPVFEIDDNTSQVVAPSPFSGKAYCV